MYTKSWFHTGAFIDRSKLSRLFAEEYWGADAWSLPDSRLPTGLTGSEVREAVRALAGKTLRTELYALDGTADEGKPYTVSEASFEVRQIQARGINPFGVYLPVDRESLAYHSNTARRCVVPRWSTRVGIRRATPSNRSSTSR